ncbi:MAG: zinc ribbon domain-containing protein [Pseudomonadota bacterium]
MPIYAFACDACGHDFDRLQKLSDADPVECPACSAAAVRRKLTAPQFRLAGGGWYETDFKKDGDTRRNLAGEGGEGAKPAPDAAPASTGGGTGGAVPASKPAPVTPAPAKPASANPAPAKPAANP